MPRTGWYERAAELEGYHVDGVVARTELLARAPHDIMYPSRLPLAASDLLGIMARATCLYKILRMQFVAWRSCVNGCHIVCPVHMLGVSTQGFASSMVQIYNTCPSIWQQNVALQVETEQRHDGPRSDEC